jgi:predicted enzyme related to lactoylglutathione lyase
MAHHGLGFAQRVCRAALLIGSLSVPLAAWAALPPVNGVARAVSSPGKFIWFDLVTDDLAASRAFYGAVFGWTFHATGPGAGDYTVVQLGGRAIGGMLMPQGATPAHARWISLMSVADAAGVAQRTQLSGGKVLVEPHAVPARGTHALLADPEGAVFGVLHSSSGDTTDAPVSDGDFFWVDLFSKDPAGAAAFYRSLMGYAVHPYAPEGLGVKRLLLSAQGVARAGIGELPRSDMRAAWLPYVLVGDVPQTLERVARHGGRVLLAPRTEVLDGQLAIVADPRGGVVGIVNWDARQPGALK